MADLAAGLILHPATTQFVKLIGTTHAREKGYRALQYFSRSAAWYLNTQRGDKSNAARFLALRQHFALTRKVLRIGRPIENLQAIIILLQKPSELAERLTGILKHISWFLFIITDNFMWANAVKALRSSPQRVQSVGTFSNWMWFWAIAFSIMNDSLKSMRLAREIRKVKKSPKFIEKGVEVDKDTKLRQLQAGRDACHWEIVMNCLDIHIPSSYLQLNNFNDGILGVLGVIASCMSLRKQWLAIGAKSRGGAGGH